MPITICTMKYAYNSTVFDYTLPEPNQMICKITQPLGNNTFKILSQEGEVFIVSLTKKFRNNIMLIPGSFVITEPIIEGKKVKGEVVRVLRPDQLKLFNAEGIWPKIFADTVHLNNTYEAAREKEKDLDHLKNIVTARRPLCSASKYLAGESVSYSQTNDKQRNEEELQSSDEESEDDMPYIEPNPNLKTVSRFVHLNNDDSDDEESEDEESEDEESENEESEGEESEDEEKENDDVENEESEKEESVDKEKIAQDDCENSRSDNKETV